MDTEAKTTDIVRAGTAAMERYIAAGDIGRLNETQRIALYRAVCESLGLNPLTQPFEYLTLSGKVTLYAKKSCTEQLRQIHGVSVTSLELERREDILCMTARVRDRNGREDIATGAVSLKGLGGEALANAYMKCETKAKRRATLSICGLAMLDETEVDSIPGATTVSVEAMHGEPAPAAARPAGKVRAAKALPEAVPAAPVAPAAPAATAEPIEAGAVEREVLPIPRGSKISVVENSRGTKVWRIDAPGNPDPIAVLDPALASRIEAEAAMGLEVRVVAELRYGKWVAVKLKEEEVGDVPF